MSLLIGPHRPGNEDGEPEREERKIRIMNTPIVTCESSLPLLVSIPHWTLIT